MIRVLASFSVGLVTGGLCVFFTFYDQCFTIDTKSAKSDLAASATAMNEPMVMESVNGVSSVAKAPTPPKAAAIAVSTTAISKTTYLEAVAVRDTIDGVPKQDPTTFASEAETKSSRFTLQKQLDAVTEPFKFSLEVVVAYCCENPTWLGSLSVDVPVTVYAKCPRCRDKLDETVNKFRREHSQPIVVKELLNVGRELHTHIHHIITNYDHLPTYTAFLQGEGGHGGTEANPRLREFADNASTYWPLIPIVPRNGKGTQMFRDADVFEPGGDRHHLEKETNVWVFRYADRKVADTDLANRARALYMALFGGSACDVPPLIFMSGTMAIVRKDKIISRSLAFWEHCKTLLAKCNPVGWDMERIWPLMFTTKDQPMRLLKKPSYCQNPSTEDWKIDTKCPGGGYKKLKGWHGYP